MLKKSLIMGIAGQNYAYLAEFLFKKGDEAHGLKCRASLFNTNRPHVDWRAYTPLQAGLAKAYADFLTKAAV